MSFRIFQSASFISSFHHFIMSAACWGLARLTFLWHEFFFSHWLFNLSSYSLVVFRYFLYHRIFHMTFEYKILCYVHCWQIHPINHYYFPFFYYPATLLHSEWHPISLAALFRWVSKLMFRLLAKMANGSTLKLVSISTSHNYLIEGIQTERQCVTLIYCA